MPMRADPPDEQPDVPPHLRTRVAPSNPAATAGLVCALIGLLLLGILFGTAALVLGLLGVVRAREGAKGYRVAIAAILLGFAAVVVFFVGVAVSSR